MNLIEMSRSDFPKIFYLQLTDANSGAHRTVRVEQTNSKLLASDVFTDPEFREGYANHQTEGLDSLMALAATVKDLNPADYTKTKDNTGVFASSGLYRGQIVGGVRVEAPTKDGDDRCVEMQIPTPAFQRVTF